MLLSEVVNKLLNDNGLTNTSAAEEARFTTFDEGLNKVNNLNARFKDLSNSGKGFIFRCRTVNRCVLLNVWHWLAINRFTHYVPNTAESLRTNWHHHRSAGVLNFETTDKAVGRRHSNCTNQISWKMELDFEKYFDVTNGSSSFNGQRIVDCRHLIQSKLNVNNRANNTDNVTDCTRLGRRSIHFFSHLVLQSCGATNDFVDLSRNSALTYTVIKSIERLNHFIGIVRRILHSVTTSSLLSSS